MADFLGRNARLVRFFAVMSTRCVFSAPGRVRFPACGCCQRVEDGLGCFPCCGNLSGPFLSASGNYSVTEEG